MAEERGVRLANELPETLPCRCDPRRTLSVVENLLDNAIKFTAESGSVTVRGTARADGVQLEVRDSGCGILPENLERIFEPFANIEAPVDNPPTHSGLGLAICRKLLSLQNGSIEAMSDGATKGATFRIFLPAPT